MQEIRVELGLQVQILSHWASMEQEERNKGEHALYYVRYVLVSGSHFFSWFHLFPVPWVFLSFSIRNNHVPVQFPFVSLETNSLWCD